MFLYPCGISRSFCRGLAFFSTNLWQALTFPSTFYIFLPPSSLHPSVHILIISSVHRTLASSSSRAVSGPGPQVTLWKSMQAPPTYPRVLLSTSLPHLQPSSSAFRQLPEQCPALSHTQVRSSTRNANHSHRTEILSLQNVTKRDEKMPSPLHSEMQDTFNFTVPKLYILVCKGLMYLM